MVGDLLQNPFHPFVSKRPRTDNRPAHASRIDKIGWGTRPWAADSDLCEALDVRHLRDSTHDIAVSLAHPHALVYKVEMRVHLYDVHWALGFQGAHHRYRYRMIASQDNRQRAARHNTANGVIDVLQTRFRAHVDHIHVPAIDNTHTGQELRIELVIVVANAPKSV